jgi:hypothetical protein
MSTVHLRLVVLLTLFALGHSAACGGSKITAPSGSAGSATGGNGGGGGAGGDAAGTGGRGGSAASDGAAGGPQGADAQAGSGGWTTGDAGTDAAPDGTVSGRCAPLRLGPTRNTVDSLLVDIDGDGQLDIITAEMDGHSAIFIQNGTRSFADPTVYDLDRFTGRAIATGDLNEDGAVDFVFSHGFGVLYLFLSARTGAFSVTTVPLPNSASPGDGISIADFDGDGHRDIAFVDYDNSKLGFLWASGPATFLPLVTIPTCPNPTHLLTVDADEDQRPDLVVACLGSMSEVRINSGARSFASPASLYTTSGVEAAASGDLNGDGHVDIVLPDAKLGRLSSLLGDGHGAFNRPTGLIMAVMPRPISAALGDLDHDGVIDLLIGYVDDPRLMFYRGDGDGHFQSGQSIPTAWSVINLRVGDIDRDGFDDILATNWGTGLTVYFGPCP